MVEFKLIIEDSLNVCRTVRCFLRLLHYFTIFSVMVNIGFPSIATAVDLDQSLIPHRAIYSMNSVGFQGDSGLSNVRGVMFSTLRASSPIFVSSHTTNPVSGSVNVFLTPCQGPSPVMVV